MWCMNASPTIGNVIAFVPSVIILMYFAFKFRSVIRWLRPKLIFYVLLISILPLPVMFAIKSFVTSYVIRFVDFSNPTLLVEQFYGCLSSSNAEEMPYFFVDEGSLNDSKAALQVYDPDNYCAWWQNERKCTPDTSGGASNVNLRQNDAGMATLEIDGMVRYESVKDLSGNTLTIINESGEIPFHHQVVVQKTGDQWHIASIEAAPFDVISVVLSFREAMNARNVDAALALFADDAQLAGSENYSGKGRIRDWIEYQVSQGARIELVDLYADDDGAFWVNAYDWHPLMQVRIRDGKIQTFSVH